jgi:hypothetical protein
MLARVAGFDGNSNTEVSQDQWIQFGTWFLRCANCPDHLLLLPCSSTQSISLYHRSAFMHVSLAVEKFLLFALVLMLHNAVLIVSFGCFTVIYDCSAAIRACGLQTSHARPSVDLGWTERRQSVFWRANPRYLSARELHLIKCKRSINSLLEVRRGEQNPISE